MLPRNKARNVSVGGERYRWLVSDTAAGAWLFVVRRDGAGARLEVPLRRELDGLYWSPLPVGPQPMTPSIVVQLMTAARSLGWEPTEAGAAFRFPSR